MEAISAGELFEIPEGITYLNCSNASPQLKSVTAVGLDAVRIKAAPWERMNATTWFASAEELRSLVAQVLGATPDAVALVPAVSYGMAIAAANLPLPAGSSVVMLAQDFPSDVYTWRDAAEKSRARVVTVERNQDAGWTDPVLAAIDERTAVVCMPRCHWTDGSTVDLVRVGRRAREVGAAFVIDASQSLGVVPLDLNAIQPDFLCSVGYKWLLGPYGFGYLYVAPKFRNAGKPIEQSWMTRQGSEDFTRLTDYTEDFQPGARRYDMGEFTQFIHAPMASAGLRQILAWGIPAIEASLAGLTTEIAERAIAAGYIVLPAEQRSRHMLGIRFPAGLPAKLAATLAREKVYISIRGDSVRVAPYLYNDSSDIERLFAAIAAAF